MNMHYPSLVRTVVEKIVEKFERHFEHTFERNEPNTILISFSYLVIIIFTFFIHLVLHLYSSQQISANVVISNFIPYDAPILVQYAEVENKTIHPVDTARTKYFNFRKTKQIYQLSEKKVSYIFNLLIDPEEKILIDNSADTVAIHPLIIPENLYDSIFKYSAILLIVLIPLMLSKLASQLKL